jgi:hypothetical protein
MRSVSGEWRIMWDKSTHTQADSTTDAKAHANSDT